MFNSKIILASKSQTRFQILKSAGLNVRQVKSSVNESKYKEIEENNQRLSLTLAYEKAKNVSNMENTHIGFVIGADQVLTLKSKRYSKALSLIEAKHQLKELRGETHTLITSVSILKNRKKVFELSQTSHLTMHHFSDEFLDNYLKKTSNKILNSVGCYNIEGVGIQLFSKIEGDFFSILGLPLVQVLNFLRQEV